MDISFLSVIIQFNYRPISHESIEVFNMLCGIFSFILLESFIFGRKYLHYYYYAFSRLLRALSITKKRKIFAMRRDEPGGDSMKNLPWLATWSTETS